MSVTHRDLARAAARWMLGSRWCFAVSWELNQWDAVGWSDPGRRKRQEALADWHRERARDYPKRETAHMEKAREAVQPAKLRNRLSIIEVKVSRSDLLADLRVSKMHGYAEHCSHMYLAGTGAAFAVEALRPAPDRVAASIANLETLGVPKTWGLLYFPETDRGLGEPYVWRYPRRLRDVTEERLVQLCITSARSFCHRILNPGSPVELADG